MSTAMLLMLLLSSGVCAKSEFAAADGRRLSVIVCPVIAEAAGDEGADDEGDPA